MGTLEEIDTSLRELQSGNRNEFTAFFECSKPYVIWFCKKKIWNQLDVDDVVQMTYIKIFNKIMTYDSSKPALPWILAITHFECLTANKKEKRKKESAETFEIYECADDTIQSADEILRIKNLNISINETLSHMSEIDRSTIFTHLNDEVTYENNVSTFRKRWQRAKKRFISTWEERNV